MASMAINHVSGLANRAAVMRMIAGVSAVAITPAATSKKRIMLSWFRSTQSLNLFSPSIMVLNTG